MVTMSEAGRLINFLLVLLELIKRTRRICGGFHLPLQSSSTGCGYQPGSAQGW
jgi:tRNA A37 methylthiotransferase MiaB